MSAPTGSLLVVRLDSVGDMLISGPAIRAVAARAARVTVLAGPSGAAAARLLPGVDDVVVYDCPWIVADPPPLRPGDLAGIIGRLAALAVDGALILTSFHQSALPTALMLRAAGVGWIAGVSTDYPGSLLDVRVPDPPDAPESDRMLAIAAAAGYPLPPGDDGRLRLRAGAAQPPAGLPGRYVALHPGASVPARTYPAPSWAAVARGLVAAGWDVVVTGGPDERELVASVVRGAGSPRVHDLAGRCELAGLAGVLSGAAVVLSGNTGPAHLAAAVATPVVSLFAPVVPAVRWAPAGVATVLLGDQQAPCRDSRARVCPVPGHPCLSGVDPATVVRAALALATADPDRSGSATPVAAGEPVAP